VILVDTSRRVSVGPGVASAWRGWLAAPLAAAAIAACRLVANQVVEFATMKRAGRQA
jgi:hypothetical protein